MPCGLLLCAITIKRAVEASFALTMTFQTFQLFLIFHFAFSDVGPLNKAVRDIFNKKINFSVAAYWSMKMTTYFAGALRCIQRVVSGVLVGLVSLVDLVALVGLVALLGAKLQFSGRDEF